MKNNKEKRILVLKVNPDCKALRFNCDPFDDDDGMYCNKSGKWVRITDKDCAKCKSPVLAGITRAEAVCKIKSAFCKNCKVQDKSCFDCGVSKEGCEAALDALLGKVEGNGK